MNKTTTETNSGWISVYDGLPQKYGDYLCRDKQNNLLVGYPINNSISYTGYAVETDNGIIYDCVDWQPLPHSYKK